MQTERASPAIPVEIRCLLTLAGSLLSPGLRSDWMREWNAEFWHGLGPNGESRRRMRARAFGAFSDAWFLLRQDCGIVRRIHDAGLSRSAPVVLLVVLLACLALATGGFRQGRELLLHDDDPGIVAVIQPVPFMGGTARMPVAQTGAWVQQSRTVAELGLWSIEDRTGIRVCKADTAAMKLLAASPIHSRCDVIQPAGPNVPAFQFVIARLRGGASIHEAEAELAKTADRQPGPSHEWLYPRVVPLAAVRKAPLAPIGSILAGFLLFSMLAIRATTVRAWIWGAPKIALTFLLIAGLWMELAARAPMTETGGIPAIWMMLVYVFPLAAGGAATRWLRRDTRHHCRVCYGPLTMPVSMGVPGRRLFDPHGTEYLCAAGHGALLLGPAAEDAGGKEWATWSDTGA